MVSQRPHGPDPYPEHSHRHPGARPSTAPITVHVLTFTTRATTTQPVVHHTTPAPGGVLTTGHRHRHPASFAASLAQRTPNPGQPSGHERRSDDPPTLRCDPLGEGLRCSATDTDREATAYWHRRTEPGATDQTVWTPPSTALSDHDRSVNGDTTDTTGDGSRRHCPVTFATAPRRDSNDGRSLKRRPAGEAPPKAAAPNGPLGNTRIVLPSPASDGGGLR